MDEKPKLLIVDDEPINLDFFKVMLEKLGFIVVTAEDGEEALERIKNSTPDLIILDNVMPKLSGWEVTRLLKTDDAWQAYRDIPIIMFSAMDDVKDKIEGFELGIEDYITKPFNFSEVLARIRAVLRSRELYRQLLAKQRHIAQIESLNKSLIYFTEHLKKPAQDLFQRAKNLNSGSLQDVNDFARDIRNETEEITAAIEGLEEEIQELRESGDAHEDHEITLKELEAKFQKHLINIDNASAKPGEE